MSRFKLLNYIDVIVISLLVFLITFFIVQFFLINLTLSIIISSIFTLAIMIVVRFFIKYKHNKKLLIAEDKNRAEIFMQNFKLLSSIKQLNLIKKLLASEKTCKIVNKKICYEKDDASYCAILKTEHDTLTENLLINILKDYLTKFDNLIIICNDYDKRALDLALSISNLNLTLLNKYDFYMKCKTNNLSVPNILIIKKEKVVLKKIIKDFFNPSHFKGFLFSGIILLFSSLIVPFKTYYLIFGSILLIFSLICKINKLKFIKNK